MRPPAGWMIVLVGSCNVALFAGAAEERRETFAVESTSAVVCRSGGLLQPEWIDILFTRLLLIR